MTDDTDKRLSLADYVLAAESDDSLLSLLGRLRYGQSDDNTICTLGWAWSDAAYLQVSIVHINGEPHYYNPLTRETRRCEESEQRNCAE